MTTNVVCLDVQLIVMEINNSYATFDVSFPIYTLRDDLNIKEDTRRRIMKKRSTNTTTSGVVRTEDE